MKRLLIIAIILVLATQVESYSIVRYSIPCRSKLITASRDSAIAQVGVREKTGHNDGYKVEQYLASVGLAKGNPYCAAGQYWCFYVSCMALQLPVIDIPMIKTGSTITMFNDVIAHGIRTDPFPKDNDLIFWRKPNAWTGHVERIIEIMKAGWVETVGFNTSSGNNGSQDNGEGVYFRKRNINHFLGRMVVRGFIGFKPV